VHDTERLVAERLGVKGGAERSVRCRVRAAGVVIELDPASLVKFNEAERAALEQLIGAAAPARLAGRPVGFAPYRVGSAFLVPGA